MAPNDWTAIVAYILILFFGLSVGSFLNVVIYRLPRKGLSISQPKRSFCPVCRSPIRWHDNIPVVSWLLLQAKCRDCKEPIAARYPLVELISGILAVILLYRIGFGVAFFIHFYFVMCLLAIALIDLELMLIPMALVYPTTAMGLMLAFLAPSMELAGISMWEALVPLVGPRGASVCGALAGFFAGWGSLLVVSKGYKLARGHDGMGDGDPPLLGMIGAFLGWQAMPLIILWSALIGLASVGILIVFSKGNAPKEGWGLKAIPYGPFLVLSTFFYIFFGQQFIRWYLSLM